MFLGVFLLSGSPLTTWAVLLGFYCLGLSALLSWRWGDKVQKIVKKFWILENK